MEVIATEVGKSLGKSFAQGVIEAGVPIILKKPIVFWKKPPKIHVMFALVIEYYEMPLMDDAWRIIEFCLNPFRKEGGFISTEDILFEYQINHEIEENYVPPDLDEFSDDMDYIQTVNYISLSDIRFFPSLKGEITGQIDGKKIIHAAYKLMNAIIYRMDNSSEATNFIKIKSRIKLIAIMSDLDFISEFRARLKNQISKDKITPNPYLDMIEYNEKHAQLVVSIDDTYILKKILEYLELE